MRVAISREYDSSDRENRITFKKLITHLKNNDPFFNRFSLEKAQIDSSTDEDKQEFFKAIAKNTTLTRLYLYGNFLDEKFILSFIIALKKNTSITKIKLDKNLLSEQNIKDIIEILIRNRDIALTKIIKPKEVLINLRYDDDNEYIKNEFIKRAFFAAECGDVDLLYTLLKKNPDLIYERHSCYETLLHHASSHGQVDCVKLLLQLGAKVNFNYIDSAKIETGSALNNAVENDHIIIVKLLLIAGAEVSFKRNGLPILHDARDLEMAKLLIGKGASIEDTCGKTHSSSDEGNTVLHSILRHKNPSPDLLLFLIREGVNVNEQNRNGDTPLNILVANKEQTAKNFLTCMNILLRAGADPFIKNNNGKTASTVASSLHVITINEGLMHAAAQHYETITDRSTTLHKVYKYPDCLFSRLPTDMLAIIATFTTTSTYLEEETKMAVAMKPKF